MENKGLLKDKYIFGILATFLITRFSLYAASTLQGLLGYGDFFHFFQLGDLPGWPYFHYWIEFPPLFSFLNEILYRLASGQEHVFYYSLALLLMFADCGNLFLFIRIEQKVYGYQTFTWRSLVFFVLLLSLSYNWWYFDPLAVLFMLLGVYLLLNDSIYASGLTLGLGFLVKLFPMFAFSINWRATSPKRLLGGLAVSAAVILFIYGILWAVSPSFTLASLKSQPNKGSWETVWALIDGNYESGNLGPIYENSDPAMAEVMRRNPPKIPAWITLLVFGAVGLWGLLKSHPETSQQRLAILGWVWSIFLLWSPGYSPQWVLYLLPVILLVLERQKAILLVVILVFINLVEWPLLLSRGFFWSLNYTIPTRFFIFIIMGYLFYTQMTESHKPLDAGFPIKV